MGKKRKNSNYRTKNWIDTDKKTKLEQEKKKKRKITIISSLICAVLLVGIVLALGFGVFGWGSFKVTHYATIEIENYGTVKLELYGKEAPITVENFTTLADSGFYNGLTFHRIIEGFMAQGGRSDSQTAETIKGEFSENGIANGILHKRGVISMARAEDYDSASSQFFIMHKTTPKLDGEYAAFGKVISGIEVIDKICSDATPYDNNGSILPNKQPKIVSITIQKA